MLMRYLMCKCPAHCGFFLLIGRPFVSNGNHGPGGIGILRGFESFACGFFLTFRQFIMHEGQLLQYAGIMYVFP